MSTAVPGDDTLELVMEIAEGETIHKVRFGDFNALDARVFRQELGTSLFDAFIRPDDVDNLAGIVWLHLRKDNPTLTYAEVAERFTYDQFVRGRRALRERLAARTRGENPDEQTGGDDPS